MLRAVVLVCTLTGCIQRHTASVGAIVQSNGVPGVDVSVRADAEKFISMSAGVEVRTVSADNLESFSFVSGLRVHYCVSDHLEWAAAKYFDVSPSIGFRVGVAQLEKFRTIGSFPLGLEARVFPFGKNAVMRPFVAARLEHHLGRSPDGLVGNSWLLSLGMVLTGPSKPTPFTTEAEI